MHNLEKIKEIINEAKNTAPTKETWEIAESFEHFLSLYEQKDEKHENPVEFFHMLSASYQKLWQTFEKMSAVYGLNIEELKEHFNNPANFNEKQWDNIQTLQRYVEEETAPKTTRSKKIKRTALKA